MMKVGIFGGTFDPIHRGHVNAAIEFYSRAELDKMYVVPTGIPPHKESAVTSGFHRLGMVQAAFAEHIKHGMNIEVSDIEVKEHGKSYTILTVKKLLEKYGNDIEKIYVYTGSDMFCCLEKWKCFEELFRLCIFAAAPRDVGDLEKLSSYAERYDRLYGADTLIMDFTPVEMSSTEIRNSVSALIRGNSDETLNVLTKKYLTEPVAKYIIENSLYFQD